jgi:hypothetical protein
LPCGDDKALHRTASIFAVCVRMKASIMS